VSSETGFDTKLYERFPTREDRPEGEAEELERIWAAPRGWAFLTVVNNSYVGIFYVAGAFLFFLLAGALALAMRAQLALPLIGILPQEIYNQFFTMHGTVMMFLFAVPMMQALAILLLPQMLGARDLPFPRLSAYAFWAYLTGGLFFFSSIFFALAPDGGWFMYPPLTSKAFSPGINADFWLIGIGFIEIAAIAGAIELLIGVLRTRAPGMTLARMPMFAWAILAFAAMILIAFPALILCTILLELERALNWPFFDAMRGGDPLLWQHLFWFFGHPEVYIIFLPAAGLMSMMVAALARTELVGYHLVVLAILATAFISFGVWSHHMFTTGMPRMSIGFFSAASMAVSIPAGIQVFAWIATLAAGKPSHNTPTLFLIGALVTFVIGGLTGVMVALVPFDWQVHDTHFIVAHFHYVLIGGAVFPMFAAFYFWFGITSRRPLSDRLGKWVFWLMFSGMQITFLPMHLTGLMGMPRRVWTYLPHTDWTLPNFISTVGAFVIAAGACVFLFDLARNLRFTLTRSAGNVYGSGSLEWLRTGSYAMRSIPVVKSREPLWGDPDLRDDVGNGRYLLPNSATGHRETIVTSPVRAEPQYLLVLPGPSVWPMLSAIFTAGFFLQLVIQAYWTAIFSGLLAIACVIRWLWATDRPVPSDDADVGAGIRLPTHKTGPQSHGWWALIALLFVIFTIWLMTVFSWFFLYGIHTAFWADLGEPLWLIPILGGYGAAAGLVLLGRFLLAREQSTRWSPPTQILFAGAALLFAYAMDFTGWRSGGIDPETTSQAALIMTFLSQQGLLVAISATMAVYLAARNARGLITRPRNATFDVVSLFMLYTAAQGAVSASLTRLFPGAFLG
jgi:cytochrome c oxidase subunit I+III